MIFLINHLNKILFWGIKTLKGGKGYTLPGYLILKIFPDMLHSKVFNYPEGVVIVSGTNGKTTTSKLITDVLRDNNISVVTNSSGSNLLRGIVTTLLLDLNFWGKPKSSAAVLEVDEFVLPSLLSYFSPKALVLLNLSRDQLDRYGETDTILSKWIKAFSTLSEDTLLITDSTQEIFTPLSKGFKGKKMPFNAFKEKDIEVKEFFNIKNINAALQVSSLYNISLKKCLKVMNAFEYAYGRGEKVSYRDKEYTLYLAKNPASFNNNLQMLEDTSSFDSLLFVLNDSIPDGRDVSWIYDIDPDVLSSVCKKKDIYISGSRCFDMASRLHYAGITIVKENISKKTLNILDIITLASSKDIVVLPNYSAMLDFREITLGKKIL